MERVIITGANGYIGSHLAKHLSQNNQVIALVDDRFDYRFLENTKNVDCVEFRLESLDELSSDARFDNADMLYHLAWTGVNAKNREDVKTQLENINYCIDILQFCESHGISRALMPGSAAELSCGNYVITGEESPAPSDMMYSATKVACRYLCQTYSDKLGIELIWPLITSIYGPGRDDNNLLSYAIKSFLKGEKPSFTGLEQEWDYLYIDDLIHALELLGDYGKKGIYPIASGNHKKLKEYVEIIRDAINPNLPMWIGELPYKKKKIDNQVFDISKLQSDTGFQPQYDFEKGIEKT